MNLKIKAIVTLKVKKQKPIPMLLMLAQKKNVAEFSLTRVQKKRKLKRSFSETNRNFCWRVI